ncbi:hypothetical protein GCM10029964_123400 [Kibdelosporangium lantanae]
MNRAPEAVDKAVDKAVDTVRRAEHMLVTGAEDVAARTRKTRRKLARKAKATQKDLRKSARKARGSIQENLQELTGKPKRRRRWPWILGLLVAAAGTAAVVKSKAATKADPFPPEPRPAEDEKAEPTAQQNGQAQPAKPAAQPKK